MRSILTPPARLTRCRRRQTARGQPRRQPRVLRRQACAPPSAAVRLQVGDGQQRQRARAPGAGWILYFSLMFVVVVVVSFFVQHGGFLQECSSAGVAPPPPPLPGHGIAVLYSRRRKLPACCPCLTWPGPSPRRSGRRGRPAAPRGSAAGEVGGEVGRCGGESTQGEASTGAARRAGACTAFTKRPHLGCLSSDSRNTHIRTLHTTQLLYKQHPQPHLCGQRRLRHHGQQAHGGVHQHRPHGGAVLGVCAARSIGTALARPGVGNSARPARCRWAADSAGRSSRPGGWVIETSIQIYPYHSSYASVPSACQHT